MVAWVSPATTVGCPGVPGVSTAMTTLCDETKERLPAASTV
jgi:hypothetical protein